MEVFTKVVNDLTAVNYFLKKDSSKRFDSFLMLLLPFLNTIIVELHDFAYTYSVNRIEHTAYLILKFGNAFKVNELRYQ